MTTNNTIHGDLDLIYVSEIPSTAQKVDLHKTNKHKDGTWIEHGEHSNHYHVLTPTKDCVINFYMDGDTLYTEVKKGPAVITHPEHGPNIIEPNTIFKKRIETEYDPFKKVIQSVVD
jgi:hypothetical protein